MALIDDVASRADIALDSDTLIYYVEEHDQYLPIVEPVFNLIATGETAAHISVISLLEVLVRPLREGRHDLAERYRGVLTASEHVTVHDLSVDIAERAASLRARHGVGVADDIVAATALEAGCQALITNNADDFRRIEGLTVLVIRDFART